MPLKLSLYRKQPDGTTVCETDTFTKERNPEDVRIQQMPNGTLILLGSGKWVGLSSDVSHWNLDVVSTDEPVEGEVAPDADFGTIKVDKSELIHLRRLINIYEGNFSDMLQKDPDLKKTHDRLSRAIERLFDKVRK